MSASMEAPQQYRQPSRKGKKAWRKNVDVTEVQEGLRQLRDERIEGGVLAEIPSEELFVVDTVGSQAVRKSHLKNRKPLKSEEILAQRSAIPAIDTHKRPNSNVTDGILEPATKKIRSDWVTNREWKRLKEVAKTAEVEKKNEQEVASYDPWAEPERHPMDRPEFNHLEKPKSKVAPPTIKQAPISLAANGKSIPAVKSPHPGISYNPVFQDWDELITKEGEKEIEAEKARLAEQKAEEERHAKIVAAQGDDGEVKSDDESEWEGFGSEYEAPQGLKKKRPERKTPAQRNKAKRRKEAEQKAKWDAQMKKREKQVAQIGPMMKTMKEKEKARMQLQKNDDSSEEGDDTVLRRRPLGNSRIPEKSLEVVLPDELQESLRLLKPEGNLLHDRFRNLLVNGKLEARKPITQPKKRKILLTEKWSHKDFKI